MKYIKYVCKILWKLFAKVFGLIWFWVVVWFRARGRNAVQNYVIANGVHLPRLLDRKPELVGNYYLLKDVHNVVDRNTVTLERRIKCRDVSTLEYQLWFWLVWGWVDDDSNHDTMSGGMVEGKIYGNTFDLGDTRGEYPELEWKESWAWLQRNTAYNFNYMLEEMAENNKDNFYVRYTTKWFDWHFGFIPYTNSTRKGRMVWFTEDIDRID